MIRTQKAACLRASGLTFPAIGLILGVSAGRARQLAQAGRIEVEPDEIVFPLFVSRTTPTANLPVSRFTRRALEDVGIETFGTYLDEADGLTRRLLRFPSFGRRRLEELERLRRPD